LKRDESFFSFHFISFIPYGKICRARAHLFHFVFEVAATNGFLFWKRVALRFASAPLPDEWRASGATSHRNDRRGVVLERTDGEEERLARGETETKYLPIHIIIVHATACLNPRYVISTVCFSFRIDLMSIQYPSTYLDASFHSDATRCLLKNVSARRRRALGSTTRRRACSR